MTTERTIKNLYEEVKESTGSTLKFNTSRDALCALLGRAVAEDEAKENPAQDPHAVPLIPPDSGPGSSWGQECEHHAEMLAANVTTLADMLTLLTTPGARIVSVEEAQAAIDNGRKRVAEFGAWQIPF